MHLGLIGYGNIARTLMDLLEAEQVKRLSILVRASSLDATRHALQVQNASIQVDVMSDLGELLKADPDLVVECAGQEAVADYGPKLLENGVSVIIASVGALAKDRLFERLKGAAVTGGAQMVLPSGAIGGIDLLASLAPAGDIKVTYRGIKPPAAWKGTLAEQTVDLDALSGPAVFFSGSARAAALSYPKNANVAATLALAGPGFDSTKVELVADPGASGNLHSYEVHSPLCRYTVEIENVPSGGNAKTSLSTVYSLLREINRFCRAVVI